MQPKRRWALIGDLHIGAQGAPWAPYMRENGAWITPSPAQEYLLECYNEYWKWVEDTGGCDTVLLGGDLIDGVNPKQSAEDLSTPEIKEQRRNAIAMLKPHCEGRKVLSVDGSRYHIGLEQSNDELIAEALGAQEHDKLLFLHVPETDHVVMAYHKGRTGTVYRASALEGECRALDAAIGRGTSPLR